MKKSFEISYYVSVGAGLALSTSSFLLISGLYEVSNFIGVVLGVVLAGFLCHLIASAVAEMAGLYPSAPGIRTYIKHGINNKLSLSSIYLYIFMLVFVAGAESHVFSLVVAEIFPETNTLILIFLVFLFVVLVNLKGLEFPRIIQIVMTSVLLLGIFLIGINGIMMYVAQTESGTQLAFPKLLSDGLNAVPAVIGIAIFLYIGFEWVTPLGINKDSYKRRIPVSMPLSIWINVIVYSSFCLGIGLLMSSKEISSSTIPQVFYMAKLFGNSGKHIALALSVLAILSTFNAGLLGGSRFIYALAREGNFIKLCASVSLKSGSPKGAILFLGSISFISAVLVNIFNLDLLFAVVSSAIVCIVYGMLLLSLPLLRKKQAQKKRSYKTRTPLPVFWILGVLMPFLGIASLFSIDYLSVQASMVFFVILTFSIGLSYWYDNKKSMPLSSSKLKWRK